VMGRLVHEPTMERANRSNANAPTNAASGSASDIFSVAFVTHGARSDVADCRARGKRQSLLSVSKKGRQRGGTSGRCRPIKGQRQAVGVMPLSTEPITGTADKKLTRAGAIWGFFRNASVTALAG
jgi:hypothetical protein